MHIIEDNSEFLANEFLKDHQKQEKINGFWQEESKSTLIFILELRYKTEIIKEWFIVDFALNGDRVLVKWRKRLFPLSCEELKDKYDR